MGPPHLCRPLPTVFVVYAPLIAHLPPLLGAHSSQERRPRAAGVRWHACQGDIGTLGTEQKGSRGQKAALTRDREAQPPRGASGRL